MSEVAVDPTILLEDMPPASDASVDAAEQTQNNQQTETVAAQENRKRGERLLAKTLWLQNKLKVVVLDPIVQDAMKGVGRLLGNGTLAAAELAPIFGVEVGYLIANVASAYQDATVNMGVDAGVNLTPDVSEAYDKAAAVMGLLPAFPGHLVDMLAQLRHDAPRIKEGATRALKILREMSAAEVGAYQQKKQQADAALAIFGLDPPDID